MSCVREHETSRDKTAKQQNERLGRDAEMLHNHRLAAERQWQKEGAEAHGRGHCCPPQWPPISGQPASFAQFDAVAKARKLDEYFQHLADLPKQIHTCPSCLQRSHNHGVPVNGTGGEHCRNCLQHPSGWQVSLADELDMDPQRETDPSRRAAKLEWAALLEKHGPLLPTEECLLSPVLCFVKVGLSLQCPQ